MYHTQGDHQDLFPFYPPPGPIVMERRWKPNVELAPNCPRCHSSNTKFCYYNNYSLTQPRYFCKSWKRYWTKGGSLRNVPIGGGYRKNRRAKSVPISTRNSRPWNSPYGNSCSPDPNSMVSSDNNNPSLSDSASIDLALVYAKLLEHEPNPDQGNVVPELPRELKLPQNFDSHLELSSHELVGCHGSVSDASPDTQLSEGQQQVLFSEFGALGDTNSYQLQPLPQFEDMAMNEMFWSNSPVVGSNFLWQQTPATPQLQGFEPTVHDDHSTIHSSPLDDNWNSFDPPSFEAFSRP